MKRVVEVLAQRVAVAGLEMCKTMERAAQGSGGMHPLIGVESVAGQRLAEDAHHALDGLFELLVAGAGITVGGGVDTLMFTGHAAPRKPDRFHCIVAAYADRGGAQVSGQDLAADQPETSNQAIEVVDVSVQGRLPHIQFLCQAGKGESVETFTVGASSGGIDHLFLVETALCHATTAADEFDRVDLDRACACSAAMTATLTMSKAVHPRDRS